MANEGTVNGWRMWGICAAVVMTLVCSEHKFLVRSFTAVGAEDAHLVGDGNTHADQLPAQGDLATIVTAACGGSGSSGCAGLGFDALENLVGSVHLHNPGRRIVVYDLGHDRGAPIALSHAMRVRRWSGVELRPFGWAGSERSRQILAKDSSGAAWKLLVSKHALQTETSVLVVDLAMETCGSLEAVDAALRTDGHWFMQDRGHLGESDRLSVGTDVLGFARPAAAAAATRHPVLDDLLDEVLQAQDGGATSGIVTMFAKRRNLAVDRNGAVDAYRPGDAEEVPFCWRGVSGLPKP